MDRQESQHPISIRPDSLPYTLPVDGFATAFVAQIAQVRSLLATAHDVLKGLLVEDMPMYSEGRP
ncbi:hypothetical protein [Streptomyces paradoxus]|uniref:hypothetical protein n=1 Tax=Streptomyces paradoxus TaxID=66375 RepID=UPI0037D4023B